MKLTACVLTSESFVIVRVVVSGLPVPSYYPRSLLDSTENINELPETERFQLARWLPSDCASADVCLVGPFGKKDHLSDIVKNVGGSVWSKKYFFFFF